MNPQSQWACVSQDPAPSNESMYNVHDIWISGLGASCFIYFFTSIPGKFVSVNYTLRYTICGPETVQK